MPDWYEVFDNERVQVETRRRVSRLVGGFIGVAAISFALLPLAAAYVGSVWVPAALALGAIGVAAAVVGVALVEQRRVTWCLKLSFHEAVGYDYARRRVALPWADVEHVDVQRDAVVIVGRPNARGVVPMLRIPTLFADFAALSHRIVAYAEAHRVPVCLDGLPWQMLDVQALYPFLDHPPVNRLPD